mgnify:CR=1 FL=1
MIGRANCMSRLIIINSADKTKEPHTSAALAANNYLAASVLNVISLSGPDSDACAIIHSDIELYKFLIRKFRF